jgi:tRNA pseudouridine38-40 synthase
VPREGEGLFHARFAAKERKYVYRLLTGRSVFEAERDWCLDLRPYQQKLNVEAMHAAAQMLVGEKYDFSSFRGKDCQAKSPVKMIRSIEVVRVLRPELAHPSQTYGEMIHIHVRAKSFLYHMVRNIVGAVTAVGMGRLPPAEMKNILEARDRSVAPPMAPAQGLFLERVLYEEDLRKEEETKEEEWTNGAGGKHGSDLGGKAG